MLLLIISTILTVVNSVSFSKYGLTWSTYPQLYESITRTGMWTDMVNASMAVDLPSDREVLFNYHIVVEGVQSFNGSTLPSEGNKDILQIRFKVNGSPNRYTSSFISSYGGN